MNAVATAKQQPPRPSACEVDAGQRFLDAGMSVVADQHPRPVDELMGFVLFGRALVV